MSEEMIAIIDGCLYNEKTGEVCMQARFVQKLVRCKDCRHKVGEHDGYICCDKNRWHEPNWFCADGERREE